MTGVDEIAQALADLRARTTKLERAAQLSRASITDEDDNDLDVAAGLSTAYTASVGVADALEAAASAQATADGVVTIYYDATAPSGDQIEFGDWWLPPPGSTVYLYDGDSWEVAPDQSVAGAFAAAANAQDTADGKIVTYWQTTLPATASDGDICFLIPTNTPYRWGSDGWSLLVQGAVNSPDYVPGSVGWTFDPDSTQVPTLNVLGELGAGVVTADAVTLDGMDLQVDLIDPLPNGAVAFASNASGSHAGNISSTRIPLFAFNLGSVTGGRLLRIHIRAHLQVTDASSWDLSVGFTTDGTDPVDGGVILDGSLTRVNFTSGYTGSALEPFDIWAYYAPGANFEQVRMKLFGVRVSGTGPAWLFLTDPNRKLVWGIEDLGDRSAANTGVLAQKKTGGGATENPSPPAAESDPTSTYTRSWLADWSRSYDGDGGTRDGDDTNDCYQGYYSGTHGRTRSLFGFNDADIRAKLAGATILSISLTYRVKYRGWSDGLDVYISEHDYDDKPSTWSGSRVNEAVANRQNCNAGGNYTISLPVATGNRFKSGATKGLGFGPGPDNGHSNYGWMYGEGSTFRPKLTIRYRK